jgi:hypothetical protein
MLMPMRRRFGRGYNGVEHIQLAADIYNELLGKSLETLGSLSTRLRAEESK